MTKNLTLRHLEVIIKIIERCNLNCSYCYFFNAQDQSFKHHPLSISIDTVEKIACFIKQAYKDFNFNSITIDFHGGEPLLLKKHLFGQFCNILKNAVPESVKLKFTVQTNGTLLSKEWLTLLRQHEVRIGVSLDGTEEINDLHRRDFHDRGTYKAAVRGIKLAQEYGYDDVAILCVVNPKANAKRIYRHFIDDLRVRNMDFLLPYISYDSIGSNNPIEYGNFLKELFNEWFSDNNPQIFIRLFKSSILLFLGQNSYLITQGDNIKNAVAITIASNGDIFADDVLKSAKFETYSGYSVNNISLRDLLKTPVFSAIHQGMIYTPNECTGCKWLNVCGGGEPVHRHSEGHGFNNKSVLCEGLKIYFNNIFNHLLKSGLKQEDLNINS